MACYNWRYLSGCLYSEHTNVNMHQLTQETLDLQGSVNLGTMTDGVKILGLQHSYIIEHLFFYTGTTGVCTSANL